MSGGHFDYKQYHLEDIADEIDRIISVNDVVEKNEYGLEMGYNYPEEIIKKFNETRKTLRLAAAMAQRVDWLVAGDDGELSFLKRWEEEVENLRENKK